MISYIQFQGNNIAALGNLKFSFFFCDVITIASANLLIIGSGECWTVPLDSGFCIFTSRVISWGYKNGPVRLCVCLFASTLTAKLLGSQKVQGLTLMISWTSSVVKVKGQGHRVKKWFREVQQHLSVFFNKIRTYVKLNAIYEEWYMTQPFTAWVSYMCILITISGEPSPLARHNIRRPTPHHNIVKPVG